MLASFVSGAAETARTGRAGLKRRSVTKATRPSSGSAPTHVWQSAARHAVWHVRAAQSWICSLRQSSGRYSPPSTSASLASTTTTPGFALRRMTRSSSRIRWSVRASLLSSSSTSIRM